MAPCLPPHREQQGEKPCGLDSNASPALGKPRTRQAPRCGRQAAQSQTQAQPTQALEASGPTWHSALGSRPHADALWFMFRLLSSVNDRASCRSRVSAGHSLAGCLAEAPQEAWSGQGLHVAAEAICHGLQEATCSPGWNLPSTVDWSHAAAVPKWQVCAAISRFPVTAQKAWQGLQESPAIAEVQSHYANYLVSGIFDWHHWSKGPCEPHFFLDGIKSGWSYLKMKHS